MRAGGCRGGGGGAGQLAQMVEHSDLEESQGVRGREGGGGQVESAGPDGGPQ